ncbi:BgTH12-00308 [Blumeria graminis f. sp. triticale]|uniref:BgTH12-00308 n=1 Tax=Blumeria graminis f. sp. triticale TaxID=1689686 RepID=A0A9W4D4W0_BLUGR|nr:BgTH12-00308 [Blumeria graminis f. sp. triticale]
MTTNSVLCLTSVVT